jgi:hypothetical protein
MNFLICPVPEDMLQESGTDTFFNAPDGTSYLYSLDYVEDEMVVIKDTCNRSVPFDINDLSGIIARLTAINNYQERKNHFTAANLAVLTNGASL